MASIKGVLLKLKDDKEKVSIKETTGEIYEGIVDEVGEDFVSLKTGEGVMYLLYANISCIKPAGSGGEGNKAVF